MAKRAAIYARISIEDQNIPKVENQLFRLRAIADDEGYSVSPDHVFFDDGVPASGKSIRQGTRDRRDGFDALVVAAERGDFDLILSVDGDRLSRNYPDGLDLIEACSVGGVTLQYDGETPIDPSTPGGEQTAMDSFVGGRREIRVRSGRQRRRFDAETQKGMPLWTRRPFGFAGLEETSRSGRISHRWVLHHPVEAPAYREAVRIFLEPSGDLGQIIEHFTSLGLKTTLAGKGAPGREFSGKWTRSSIRAILTNPRYAGFVIRDGKIVEGVTAAWEPLVDMETWQALQEKLASRRIGRPPKAHSLGGGIVRCACGAKMTSARMNGGRPGLRCRVGMEPKILRDNPNAKHGSIDDSFLVPDLERAVAAAFIFGPKDLLPKGIDMEPVAEKLRKVRESRARLVRLVADGDLALQDARSELGRLQDDEDQLTGQEAAQTARLVEVSQLVDLRQGVFDGGKANVSRAVAVELELIERFQALPLDQRRALLRLLLDVTVNPAQGVKGDANRKRVQIVHKIVTSLNEGGPQLVVA